MAIINKTPLALACSRRSSPGSGTEPHHTRAGRANAVIESCPPLTGRRGACANLHYLQSVGSFASHEAWWSLGNSGQISYHVVDGLDAIQALTAALCSQTRHDLGGLPRDPATRLARSGIVYPGR